MGQPKHARKKYARPRKPWDKRRLEEEGALKKQYGFKNKRELWRTEEMLRKKRHSARRLLAMQLEQRIKREQELIASLIKIGMLDEKATLDDVLTLNVQEMLERRLQTIVYRKGLANTLSQARQFIVHGHIALNGKKLTTPSYIVKRGEENKLSYYGKQMILEHKTKEQAKKEFDEIEKETKRIKGEKAEETEKTPETSEESAEEAPATEGEADE